MHFQRSTSHEALLKRFSRLLNQGCQRKNGLLLMTGRSFINPSGNTSSFQGFAALHPSKLSVGNTAGINILKIFYRNDIDQVSLLAEYEVFRHHSEFHTCTSISEVLKLLYQKQLLSAYPNITCLYRILRSTMKEARLSSCICFFTTAISVFKFYILIIFYSNANFASYNV